MKPKTTALEANPPAIDALLTTRSPSTLHYMPGTPKVVSQRGTSK